MADLERIRHSCAHILAAAVKKLWPDTKLGIGPVIEDGFYYDFDTKHNFSLEDFPKIENLMKQIIEKNETFTKEILSESAAKKVFKGDKYKAELICDIKERGEEISIYRTGDFVDLCHGPHVERTKEIRAFRLLKVSGSYWKGDAKNHQMQRIYGTAFDDKKALKQYLFRLEEAKRRDHKVIAEKQDLYMHSDLVGKGLPIWLPKGEVLKREVEKLALEVEDKAGFMRVTTPHLAKEELFLTSGHLPHYEDSMYPKMVMDDGTYYLKAMNCPIHHLIFGRGLKSYRDLPYRIAEYGVMYRNELSGALSGLLRVRMLSMNDAHIYCTKEQIGSEIKAVVKMIEYYYKLFGFDEYHFRLSLWDPKNREKYLNEPTNWNYTEDQLRKVLNELKVPYVEAKDEAAFYGPKIDIQFKTVLGREETMSTIQLDFGAKSRFNLRFVDQKGDMNNEVFVIHRAPLSTHERFIAFLIELYAGKFPVWLAPVQVAFITVADRHIKFAEGLQKEFAEAGFRVELDSRTESISKKVRDHQQQKVPYVVTLGDKELESGNLAVRSRDNKVTVFKREEFLAKIKEEVVKRSAD